MVNKRGWLRILEATIAIMLIAGVLLAIYSRSSEKSDISYQVSGLQREILLNIAANTDLRNKIISAIHGDNTTLANFVNQSITSNLDFEIKICDLAQPCKMSSYIGKDVFADDVIISSTLEGYSPKKVVLFVWER